MEWEGERGLCERRGTRIFPVKTINTFQFVFFFAKVTLNSCAMQLPFTTDFHEKGVVSFISFTPKIVPHTKYAYSSNSSSRRIELELYFSVHKKLRMLLRYRKFNELIIFFSTNVNSSLFCLNCWKAVTNPPLFSDVAIWRVALCWTDAVFKIIWQNCIACKVKYSVCASLARRRAVQAVLV